MEGKHVARKHEISLVCQSSADSSVKISSSNNRQIKSGLEVLRTYLVTVRYGNRTAVNQALRKPQQAEGSARTLVLHLQSSIVVS